MNKGIRWFLGWLRDLVFCFCFCVSVWGGGGGLVFRIEGVGLRVSGVRAWRGGGEACYLSQRRSSHDRHRFPKTQVLLSLGCSLLVLNWDHSRGGVLKSISRGM